LAGSIEYFEMNQAGTVAQQWIQQDLFLRCKDDICWCFYCKRFAFFSGFSNTWGSFPYINLTFTRGMPKQKKV